MQRKTGSKTYVVRYTYNAGLDLYAPAQKTQAGVRVYATLRLAQARRFTKAGAAQHAAYVRKTQVGVRYRCTSSTLYMRSADVLTLQQARKADRY